MKMNSPMQFCWHASLALLLLLTFGVIAAAADEWESLPGGVLGQRAKIVGTGGIRIAGYIRRPAGEGPFPLVVLLHGGAPTAKPVQAANPEELTKLRAAEADRASDVLGRAAHPPIPDLLAQGWAVYYVDFRPNPRYTLDPLEWDDTLAAIEKARSFSFVDKRRLALAGGSHGGHVTGRVIARTGLCCAVLFAPAGLDLLSLARLADEGAPIGGNQRLVREFEQRSGVKMADVRKEPTKFAYSSPLTEIPRVKCPVLLISGQNDHNAPQPVMDEYVTALRAAGQEADAWHPENGPHGFYFGLPRVIPETAESTRHMVDFLKRHFEAAAR